MTEETVRIAQLSCGPEDSGVPREIYTAAEAVGAEIFFPDLSLCPISEKFQRFRLDVKSGRSQTCDCTCGLRWSKVPLRQMQSLLHHVFGVLRAIVRNELRRYIHEHSRLLSSVTPY
jgi:activator of 2-hydroxyglutaryl-CoA dehydratase